MKKEVISNVLSAFEKIKKSETLIEIISANATMGFCCDIMGSMGISPLTTISPNETAEIASYSDTIFVNLGQLDDNKSLAINEALDTAIKMDKPVMFDPEGAVLSNYRRNSVEKFITMPWHGIVKGNLAEIQSILRKEVGENKIDLSKTLEDNSKINLLEINSDKKIIKSIPDVANKQFIEPFKKQSLSTIESSLILAPNYLMKYKFALNKVFAITGETDIIISTNIRAKLKHLSSKHSLLIGLGTSVGGLCSAFLAYTDSFNAAIGGLSCMSLADYVAEEISSGYGDYKQNILNAISKITPSALEEYLNETLTLEA